MFFQDGTVSHLEELAHVIARTNMGPRGNSKLSAAERDQYANIILLCPTCHSLVDKNPDQFDADLLRTWKKRHEDTIRSLFLVSVYESRKDLAQIVQKLLRSNSAIFNAYGPHSSHAETPMSDAATDWRQYVITDIIPNNRKISNLLRANEHLLTEKEKSVSDAFVLHQEALEYNHLSGDKTSSAPLFPEQMNAILRD